MKIATGSFSSHVNLHLWSYVHFYKSDKNIFKKNQKCHLSLTLYTLQNFFMILTDVCVISIDRFIT